MAKFCGGCGTKVNDEQAEICTKCGSDPNQPTKHCTNCGAQKKSESAVACLECGHSLTIRDTGIALLLAIGCFLFVGAPSIAYLYLGKTRKALIYLLGSWGLPMLIFGVYVIGSIFTLGAGFLCLLPLFMIPLLLDLAIIYDVYLISKGRKPKLPEY